VVLDGRAHIESENDSVDAGAGTLASFAPDEVRRVRSDGGARLLLFFAPWPGEGHYRGEEKSL
jgi:hypothetical protein